MRKSADVSFCLFALSRFRLIAFFFALLSFFPFGGSAETASSRESVKKLSLQRGTEQITVLAVEIVSGDTERRRGLAGRAHIPDDFGMLFLLDTTRAQSFWMNGMEFPLDILFFDKDKRLIKTLTNLSPCSECTIYEAPSHAAYAIEINGGLTERLRIREGDRIVFTDE